MSIQSINLTTQELVRVIGEMNAIAAKQNPTKADELRNSQLLARFAHLKNGVSPAELAAARNAEILSEIRGVAPAPISPGTFEEWRAFIKTPGAELRTDSQATSQWGNATGLSYDGNSGALVPSSFYSDRIFSMLADVDELIDPANCTLWNRKKAARESCLISTTCLQAARPLCTRSTKQP